MEIKTYTTIIEVKALEKAAAERLKYLYSSYADDCAIALGGGRFKDIGEKDAKESFQEIMRLRNFLGL